MNAMPDASRHIVSELAFDPDMVELASLFVQEQSEQATALEICLAQGDCEQFVRLARQLKGSARGYGLPTVTERAAVVEQQARARDALQDLCSALQDLIRTCRAARARPDNA